MKRHQILPIQNHVTKRENGKTGKRENGNCVSRFPLRPF